ncbi:MAG TPA: family 43 glycosylhydrolase [Clostridiales bacterium]|nr:family 43 glycosylhydrolase [Clostridiales bacterium]
MKAHKNRRNPILPLEYHIPDGEAHVMPDGRLYIYGSFDNQEDTYCSDRYHVVSTADMEHWTVHDISLKGQEIPWINDPDAPKYPGIDWKNPTPFIREMLKKMLENADMEAMKEKFGEQGKLEKPPLLFAPDAICKDGTYYLYFCMSDDSEGVAVSNKPEGPFKNPVRLPCGGIDPAIFIDDDGKAYYYWGQLFAHGVQLNEDMISFDTEQVIDNLVTEEEHYFHEGSSMRKIGDTYYYVYTNIERGKPTSLGYATSKSPLGPFIYRGIIIDNDGCDPASWNNHGSIEKFGDQWYVFYHRCSRGCERYRRLCIEPITIEADGTIPEIKMTSQGVGDPFKLGEVIKGYQACGGKGSVYIDVDHAHGEKLTSIKKGDEAVFRYVRSDEAFSGIRISAAGSGVIEVVMSGKKAGTIVIEAGIQKEENIKMEPGEHELVLRFTESNDLEIFDIVLL